MISTKNTLAKLIELTKERDAAALEILFTQAIFDLVLCKATIFYRVLDAYKDTFLTVAQGKEEHSVISSNLKNTLLNCIKTQVVQETHQQQHNHTVFFPVQDLRNKPVAIIAVESPKDLENMHEVVGLLIQIYQNITSLISDNEHDTLTGLLNRKTFETKITKVFSAMLSQHDRQNDQAETNYFLAIFDIDHFKRVNDDFGHLMGDEVLLLFSQLMTKSFREKDLLFRFGGEEFVAVFECPLVADMEHVLNRFREKVSQFSFPQVGNVNISAGFTQIRPYDTPAQLIDRADVSLYYAKNNGRNQVSNYDALIISGKLQENIKEGEIELF